MPLEGKYTMNGINIEAIKSLREKTQAGIMDCKTALVEATGDIARATELLLERGFKIAEKKAERTAIDGVAYADVINGHAVMIEVNTESDFVAGNEHFMQDVRGIARAIGENNPADMEEALQCTAAGEPTQTVQEILQGMSLAFREKIVFRRFGVLEGAMPFAYTHMKGQLGVILTLSSSSPLAEDVWCPIAKELAFQIAASAPQYVSRDRISADERAQIEAAIAGELLEDDSAQRKPQAIREKILTGRIEKYYRTHCLLEQAYIKAPEMTVEAYLQTACGGEKLQVTVENFLRYQKAEGLQRDEGQSNQAFARQISKR